VAEKLSADISERLGEALASWHEWVPEPHKLPTVEVSLSGHSNHSFKITDGLNHWSLRLNTTEKDPGIDRVSELSAIREANMQGIAPQVVFATDEVLITEFVDGTNLTLSDLASVGGLFARIHGMSVEIAPLDLGTYLQDVASRTVLDLAVSSCVEKIIEIMPDPGSKVLCHQDLLLENIIDTDHGVMVIDWEFARMSDAAFDIAVFSSTYNLDDEQLAKLLSGYRGNESSMFHRVRDHENIYALIEILWWQLRGRRLDKKIESLHRNLFGEPG
jgi:tRNA A-37 threonylcarbamoyl transferase component Bud32|tara:strand:- start:410 stop:1231 length:822 start_codon:yes stop_codon:yes gene_type:complete